MTQTLKKTTLTIWSFKNMITLNEAYDQNKTKVKAIVQSRVSNYHDGEQIIQEVWKRVCVGFESYDQKRPFDSWAFRFCANAISDFYRRAYVSREVSMSTLSNTNSKEDDDYADNIEDLLLYEQSVNEQPTAIALIISGEKKLKVHKAISLLPEAIRYCIDSYYIYGNKVGEIAEELSIPANTVKSRLRIGRERLAYLLSDEKEEV